MTTRALPEMDIDLRAKIIADPTLLLEDKEVMRALVAANDDAMGQNVVDLRAIAMERLEARLDRLEDAHRSVIAAAYENVAGTNLVHRAVLRLLEAQDFPAFLDLLANEIPAIMRVHSLSVVIEGHTTSEAAPLSKCLIAVPVGFIADFLGRDASRTIALHQIEEGDALIHGSAAAHIRSEACLKLDLGEGRREALLVLGSEDPHHFNPHQGTELLSFFCSVFERALRRWLS